MALTFKIDQAQELKCLSCNEMFAQQSVLTKHIVENHISEKSNICDLCGKVFSHSSSVIYHKEVRTPLTNYLAHFKFHKPTPVCLLSFILCT